MIDLAFSVAMAEAAGRAYKHELATIAKGGVEILIEEMGDKVIVAFRGTTANYSDIMADLKFRPAMDDDIGLCHRGFLEPTRDIYPDLRNHLKTLGAVPNQIILVGHSKGGAEATDAAAIMVKDPEYPGVPGGLYTYGCPRVGFPKLGRVLQSVYQERWCHGWDCVPSHPSWVWGYRHTCDVTQFGEGVHLFEDHRMADYIDGLTALRDNAELT